MSDPILPQKRVVRVTRAQVYAARARVLLDQREGRPTERWVQKLAHLVLPHEC